MKHRNYLGVDKDDAMSFVVKLCIVGEANRRRSVDAERPSVTDDTEEDEVEDTETQYSRAEEVEIEEVSEIAEIT